MKKLLSTLFIQVSLFTSLAAIDGTSTPGTSRMQPFQSTPQKKPAAQAPYTPPPQVGIQKGLPVPQMVSYLHPGVIFFQNGVWEGGDHLLNLTNNIGVYVSIIKPENDQLPLTEDQLRIIVEQNFRAVNINPVTLATPGEPPLPAFQIQILAYPIEKGYVVACEGRLFESVKLSRFILDPGTAFQAVTWEKKTLQVGPTSKIAEQIQGCVGEISRIFAERYDAYERRKRDLK